MNLLPLTLGLPRLRTVVVSTAKTPLLLHVVASLGLILSSTVLCFFFVEKFSQCQYYFFRKIYKASREVCSLWVCASVTKNFKPKILSQSEKEFLVVKNQGRPKPSLATVILFFSFVHWVLII